tara:strand:+ start:2824 stop:3246 length:423 start_codon:yes stop_codon:yes gene_type:complete
MSLSNAQITDIQNILKTAINAAIDDTLEEYLSALGSDLDSWDIADDIKTAFEGDIDELCDNAADVITVAAGSELTKKTLLVIGEYKAAVLPRVKYAYERDGIVDGPARREAWADLIDAMNKSGALTDTEADEIDFDVEAL